MRKTEGMVSNGVNTPQMKTMAMRMTVAGGIASGMSLKGEDKKSPKAENRREDNNIPKIRSGMFRIGVKNIIIAVYARDKSIPKRNPASTFPKTIVEMDVGAVRSMLIVFVFLSKGSDTACIAPAPKKEAIAIRPGMAV